ncbi:DUF2850 domain-containing protein [Vibrio sp. 99-70-13A1]|uniref:DUF2850 domain-containing protein n=1 Tax=Vibrio sp. 99-70-13A1 TaxID=2607601 RepID=UPI0020A39831|nr:DUF2850 domain-containing protein [Vibrio sp. 99-70-13A1]
MANKKKSNHARNMLIARVIFGGFALAAIAWVGVSSYQSHLEFTDPSNVYGNWIEVGSPPYQTDKLSLSEKGVIRNHRLISTSFEFDGSNILITTGSGVSIYKMSGNIRSPQLKRISPAVPPQTLVKEGFEHTVTSVSGGASQRRASLAEHFNR